MLWWKYGRKRYKENFEKTATADCKYLFPKFSDNLKCIPKVKQEWKRDNGVIYQHRPEFEDYKGARVLIIGGGGSTNTMDWDKLEDYDYIWSVNHFFLHPILKDKKVDLAMMMGEPDLNRKEWRDYRNKFQPLVGFEVSERWEGCTFDNEYRGYFCMHTFDYNILGACVRMIEFACVLNVSQIDFIGLDGVESIYEVDHAFEPGKTTLPGILDAREKTHGKYIETGRLPWKADIKYSSSKFQMLYDGYWGRIKKDYPDIKFKNLGGGEHYHEVIMCDNSG